MKKITINLIIITFAFFATSCQKEYDYLKGPKKKTLSFGISQLPNSSSGAQLYLGDTVDILVGTFSSSSSNVSCGAPDLLSVEVSINYNYPIILSDDSGKRDTIGKIFIGYSADPITISDYRDNSNYTVESNSDNCVAIQL